MNKITNLLGYQLTDQLYTGTRTLVYRGIRTSDQQLVVIKILRNEYPNFNELIQFRNQYTITKNLDFPSIIKPLALEIYQNSYALIMEDFGGISLTAYRSLITTESQSFSGLPLANFFQIAIQLTDILSYLYQNRVIHKDIKPANILINPDSSQIKLIDFSISSLLPRETQEIQNPNVLEGTLAYLSPEQTGRMNRGIDYRSDFYSLGITFYELLTGKLPFVSTDAMELVHAHLTKQALPLHKVSLEIPLVVSEIVRKLMAKNAENRYQSALGIKHDLEKCLAQLQSTGQIEFFELGERDISDRFTIPEKLYGRETEVANLLQAFERVSTGSTEMMLVAGFSGIGKTAVVNEVHKPIARQRGYFIKGKYDQFQRNIPFSAFVQSFRDLMGQLLSESDAQLNSWKTRILEAVGDNGQVLIDVIPELERIINKQPPAPELSGSAAQNRFNLLMQKFVQVFTAAEHPLVMFLDDLQWADSASLKLLQVLMNDTGHLLVLGAYRDNEVSPLHPFILMMEEIIKAGARVNTITLQPLSLGDINQLVADTMNCELSLAQPLTELIYQKTKGNPFFATQFLKALHEDGQIAFDWETCHWQCDIALVKALALTDDVVEFMALQLQKLPTETQDVLKLAACVGAQFDLDTLAIISESSVGVTATTLWEALQEGLIIPNTEIYKFFLKSDSVLVSNAAANPTYRFLHDRVQQAAYSLIPNDQKQATHLKIGQLLQQNSSAIEKEEKLFDIVGHLNLGIELITQPSDRQELAELNLGAGRKAKTSTAYAAAMIYLQTAMTLLTPDCWQNQYELTLNIYITTAEAEYLNLNFEESLNLAEVAMTKANNLLDKVKVYELQMQIHIAQLEMVAAVDIGLEVLEKLTIHLLAIDVDQELIIELPDLDDLDNLSTMTDPYKLAAMQILKILCAPVFMARPEIFPQIIITMINLCLEYGNSGVSSFAYGFYGLLLVGFGQLDRGYHAGLIALKLLDKFNAKELKAKVYNLFNSNIRSWKEHARNSVNPLREGVQAGLEVGDLEWGGYCAANLCSYLFFTEDNLESAVQQQGVYVDLCINIKQEIPIHFSQVWRQLGLNLQRQSANPLLLVGESFDEEKILPRIIAAKSGTVLFVFYVAKTILLYLLGDSSQALKNVGLAEEQAGAAFGFMQVVVLNFYHSLILLNRYPTVPVNEQQQYLDQVNVNQEKMKFWAENAPEANQHKYELIEAEKARVSEINWQAAELYDRAITKAKQQGYIQEEALANELAAKFFLEWEKERLARAYMIEAYYTYSRWGAKAKVTDLESRYPQLLAPILEQASSPLCANETIFAVRDIAATSAATSSSSNVSVALDLATILKASQTLSSKIELENLLTSLLRIVIENAGADKCVLMLLQDDALRDTQDEQLVIKGSITEGTEPVVLQNLPVEDSQDIPLKLIYQVKHDRKSAVLLDATGDPTLANDPYIMGQQPKSILCSPILQQGKLLGVLYLENRLATGAFTNDRVELLNLLCAQAAISIENARLYERSQQSAQQLEQSLTELSASNARFEKLVDNVPGIVYQTRMTADGVRAMTYISADCYDLLEVTPEQATANMQFLTQMIHPDHVASYQQSITHSIETLTSLEWSGQIITPSGIVKWIHAEARIQKLGDGTLVWDGLMVDSSDRKRIEIERQDAQQKLVYQMEMLDLANDAIIIRTIDDKISYWNQGAERLYGWNKSEALGEYIHTFLSTTSPRLLKEVFAEAFQTGSWEGELLHINRAGKQVVVSSRWTLQRDAAGQPLAMLEINNDITDAYDELRLRQQAEASLAKEREFLNAIIHNITDGIVVCDATGILTLFNKATREFHGIPVASLPPEQWAEHFDLYQADGQTLLSTTEIPLFRALQGEIVENAEMVIVPKHGSKRIVLSSGQAIIDPAGNKVGAVAVMRDISDRKQAELALQQKSQDLQQALNDLQDAQLQIIQNEKMSALGNLVAGVAHEMNNPLGFISASLKQAKPTIADIFEHLRLYQESLPNPNEEIQDHAEEIDLDYSLEDLPKIIDSMTIACDRLENISTSLRTFSRADQDYKVPFNIHQGLDSTILILKHRLKANDKRPEIEVITEYSSLPQVECFPGQLNQVFMNILANAIDALDESNTNRSFQEIQINPNLITIKTSLENDDVKIAITDNGKGMTEEIKQKIFDHLFTTKGIDKGTGLGLAIARQIIIEKHNGSLEVNSTPGVGTEFVISLPIKAGA